MPSQIGFAEIVNRSRSFSDTVIPEISADVTANLPVEIALEVFDGAQIGLELPFEFALSVTPDPDLTIKEELKAAFEGAELDIVDAKLDVASLADPLAEILEDFDATYNPLSIREVKAALDTEIPLIETTVGEIMDFKCTIPPDKGSGQCLTWQLLRNVGPFATELRSFAGGPLEIGSYQILPAPDEGVSRYTAPGDTQPSAPPDPEVPPADDTGGALTLWQKLSEKTGGFLSAPILTDYGAIMGIVLGGELSAEVDIIRLEIPVDSPIILGRSFNLKQKLAELDVGFLEGDLSVALNGGIGLIVRMGSASRTITCTWATPFL